MQRLRSTFKRSRTPTGSEMKSQSSLEVPKQVRSASFDEIQLEAQRQDDQASKLSRMNTSSSSSSTSPAKTSEQKRLSTLRVPQLASGQRSKSFDVCERGSLLPTSPARSSGSSGSRKSDTPLTHVSGCYHCACLEEYKAQFLRKDSSDNESDDDDIEDNDLGLEEDISLPIEDEGDSEDWPREGSPEIRVTLMSFDKPTELEISPESTDIKVDFFPGERPRRLSRQEAVISFPGDLAFTKITLPSILGPDDDEDESRGDDDDDDDRETDDDDKKCQVEIKDIYLTVPELKRDRAASVDSCFNNNKNGKGDGVDSLAVPQQSTRSKSVDIVLPTDQQTRYTALLPSKDQRARGSREETGASSSREPRSTPDWGPDSVNGEHLWSPTTASGDFCSASECSKHGQKLKCAACRVVAHSSCASHLNFECKTSFRDVGVRQYREQTSTHHHWVHSRSQKGKCENCSKAFQSKLSFSSKEIVAVSCSWCKLAYHNKEACFNVQRIGENCELGMHSSIIVPPSWIVKLPRKGSFKSSLRKSPRRKKSSGGGGTGASSNRRKSKEKEKEKDDKDDQGKLWVIKPIPTATIRPVLVFINPKSGGNQGAKLLQKFQWILNPRQVFDLTQGGPRMGLELFKKVPNLRVLACGGDGTVGWVLSILDQIGCSPPPAVGVLPLGTGNDLARELGWGGGYTDEPIGKILSNIGDCNTTLLDRWSLEVTRNPDATIDDDSGKGKDNLPLNVVNNYFSLGVDAHIALEFHEAREAHPEKFNSRLRNKMFYGQMGGKDLVKRKWKDLSEYVTLECDGEDMTPKLKEHRVHAIVFLNISSYGGGTHPWASGSGTKEPATDDGIFEVVGLTTYQLPLLQAGGSGTSITQCSTAKLVTTKTIPMQVDGEACRVLPSIIEMKHLNKATMLAKRRSTRKSHQNVGVKLESLKLPLMRIKMRDYETHHSDKDRLKKSAVIWREDPLELEAAMDLESLRKLLAKDYPMDSCCFLDSCTAERFFRIDRGQEQLHYVTDVASEAVYVLEEDNSSQTANETESATARASPSEEKPRGPLSMTEDRSHNRQRDSHSRDRNERSAGRRRDLSPPMKSQKYPMRNDMTDEKYQKSSSSKQTAGQSVSNFFSPKDRLFGLTPDVHTFSTGLLEKTSDAIIRSAKNGDLKALKELHERGYSLLSIDASGQTALHLASKYGHKDIVRYLISCAPPTIIDMIDNDKGQTALHKAAQQKRRSICCMLVAGGATLTVRDRHGNTPRQLALAVEDKDLAEYLESQEQFLLMTEEMQNLP